MTLPNFDGAHICGFTAGIHSAIGAKPGWRYPQIDIYCRQFLPGFNAAKMREAFEYTRLWNEVCGVDLQVIDSMKEARRNAGGGTQLIIVDVDNIDGNSGVLAWSELANSTTRKVQQMYDKSELFVLSLNPAAHVIDLWRVLLHEVGHALGMDHIATRRGVALLNPMYSRRINTPQALDIAVVQGMYGKPLKTVSPPSNPKQPPKEKEPPVANPALQGVFEALKPVFAGLVTEIKNALLKALKENMTQETLTALLNGLVDQYVKNALTKALVKGIVAQVVKMFFGTPQEKAQLLAVLAPDEDPEAHGLV